ncbi:hypothetical protein HAX54_049546 [Datura stramonium]|uniref:Uncharacterized protein n=1 Tax=Datura stramonium TaxID=4076 RepID=A0ABS8WPG4_DATST|nr:hypothetical protein [Datura stramonium]
MSDGAIRLRGTHPGFPKNILLEKFYTDLDPLKQLVANDATGGCFINTIYNHIATILYKITKHNHAWHAEDQSSSVNVGASSLTHLMKENQEREHIIAAMATNLTLLTNKLNKIEVKKVNAVEVAQDQQYQDQPSMQVKDANYISNASGVYPRPYFQQQNKIHLHSNYQSQ